MIKDVFGDEALSHVTTYTCWKCFKEGWESLKDDEWCGKQSTAVHNENVTKMWALLLTQPHPTLRAWAKELNIGKDTVHSVLTE